MPDKLPVDGKVRVGKATFDLGEVYDALRIDPNHILDALEEQASLYAYWSTLAEEAAIVAEVARRRLDFVEADLDREVREDAREEGHKTTEEGVKRAITRHNKFQDALDGMLDARRDAAVLGVMRRALEQRLSALIAINNRDRSEMAATGRD